MPLNFGDHPHSLHGLGWQRPWTVLDAQERSARLIHGHDGGPGWPWCYSAEQRVRIDESGLRIVLTLTNEDQRPMPAGLGLHPYFPLDTATRLTFRSGQVWLADWTMIPTEAAPADHFGDWSKSATVSESAPIDNSYDAWDGKARIDHPTAPATWIEAEGAAALHLFIPPGAGFFCVEPVSHLPDALNRPGFAMDVLAPGETMRLALRIGAAAQ